MRLSEFDYSLPKELIAQYPIEKRDASKLLVIDRKTDKIAHRRFADLTDYISEGDCVILNDTKVIPARLIGKRKTGGLVDVLLIEKKDKNTYSVLLKSRRVKQGERINFADGKFFAKLINTNPQEKLLEFECNGKLRNFLEEFGLMPLPPYIKRIPQDLDKKTYQTIYAKNPGAIAAPTAGLHFTKEVFDKLNTKGINTAFVTLHVGWATFRPVKVQNIEEHKMEQEYFKISKKTAEIINKTKEAGKKILAVGTTTCRALEANSEPIRLNSGFSPEYNRRTELLIKEGFTPLEISRRDTPFLTGFTDLFIYPPYKFKIVDKLLTNFHLPRTTLLMLVSAFCDKGLLFKGYRQAIERKYRFYSYGDAMLIV